uniref:Uncharacterized protein n=1 Tax=Arundo donax TaxID=35708 RepID=A0A0A9DNW8_ARUDO
MLMSKLHQDIASFLILIIHIASFLVLIILEMCWCCRLYLLTIANLFPTALAQQYEDCLLFAWAGDFFPP